MPIILWALLANDGHAEVFNAIKHAPRIMQTYLGLELQRDLPFEQRSDIEAGLELRSS